MADKPERQSFNFANQDWDGYIKYRPVYPAEVYNTPTTTLMAADTVPRSTLALEWESWVPS
jgi:hypothetical protein